MTKNTLCHPDLSLNRRQFLKLCGSGAAALFLSATWFNRASALPMRPKGLLGRVTLNGHKLRREPDHEAEVLEEMKLDSLWPITGATVSEDKNQANRIWYELDGIGFSHSGRIQPVRDKLNPVSASIPAEGCLGEVTVPFVDAYTSTDAKRFILYRFYYASTFWVLNQIYDQYGGAWYELLDDRYYRVFYVPAATIRLVPDRELSAISPEVPEDEKHILVDLATQSLWAYEGDLVVFMARISSGIRLEEGGFATPRGRYRTIRKRPCRHMANPANAYGSGFDLPGVPWVSYFTSDGVAFHGAYWHNNFGNPHSHGCINMAPQDAKWLYRWTTPTVPPDQYVYSGGSGTQVVIR